MRISAIIPAFNEEQTIAEVVRVVKKVPIIDEIIVVSDGSTDKTASFAEGAGATVYDLSENHGKGGAMCLGAQNSSAEVCLFLDGDLLGLTAGHVKSLVEPVLTEDCEMSVGIFESGRIKTDLAHIFAPFLSGQRAIRRELFNKITSLEYSRFGVEIALTRYCMENHIKVKKIYLHGVTHVTKEEKFGLTDGIKARIKMYWEIAKCVSR